MLNKPFVAGRITIALTAAAFAQGLVSGANAHDAQRQQGNVQNQNTPLADQHAPAGVMFDHMHKAGEFMLGFRYAHTSASGDMLHGTDKASDHEIAEKGCAPHTCSMTPSDMAMNMYMLDIMYALDDLDGHANVYEPRHDHTPARRHEPWWHGAHGAHGAHDHGHG